MQSAGDFIKDRDLYGQPITLNYQGSDSYQTIPGGLLSMILLISVLAYTFLKGKYMVDKEEWSLIQQTVMATKGDLITPKRLNESEFRNISIGIQFYEKREKLTLKAK